MRFTRQSFSSRLNDVFSVSQSYRFFLSFGYLLAPTGALIVLVVALFDISISNIDCRYNDTFEKYRYRYGDFENIDINIDIDKAILKISISIGSL